jgi:SAM-dependent methyltransferase
VDLNEQMRADWNRRAVEDAFYHVAFERRLQGPDEFLANGIHTAALFERELIYLPPADPASLRALEVGCGPGRLMRPMSRHFGEIHGIDISDEMLKRAREVLNEIPHAHVHLAPESDLRMFAKDWFDFVYSYAVFQHIPSREVVLNYLDEMARVLKPAGILCCQLRGAPAPSSELRAGSPTWTGDGYYFELNDIRDFVSRNRLQLLTTWCLETLHMLITVRKPARPIGVTIDRVAPVVLGVRPSGDGYSRKVPRRGRQAAVSLWIAGLPEDCGLTDLEVSIGGTNVTPCHIALGPESARQINALLPRNIRVGRATIGVTYRGQTLAQTFELDVTEGDPEPPLIVSVADAENLALQRLVCSSALKIVIQNIENPDSLRACLGKVSLELCEIVREDPVMAQYEYTLQLPDSIDGGNYLLAATVDGFDLPPVSVEIEAQEKRESGNLLI